MRIFLLLATTTMLAACGGAGPQSFGSVAPPVSSGGGTVTPAPTATHSFVAPTEIKTYQGVGGAQHYEYKTRDDGSSQYSQFYAGDANTVRDSGISVNYNPRDAIFEITIVRNPASVSVPGSRFQDPVHRTDFGGAVEPQAGVAQIDPAKAIQYLEAGSSSGRAAPVEGGYLIGENGYSSANQTFFYQKPGTTTNYVTFAGYVRNTLSTATQIRAGTDPITGLPTQEEYLENSYSFDRAAFAYGERTDPGSVPRSGSGTYTGDMLATIVYNTAVDFDPGSPTYFQWISGRQTTNVDFGTLGVTTALTGKVLAPTLDAYTSGIFALAANTDFTANAKGVVDLVGTGGFVGSFTDAKFTTPDGTALVVAIAGSSLDGAFFGPNAVEVGGGFRIVGGTPDERVDILGTFTGKK